MATNSKKIDVKNAVVESLKAGAGVLLSGIVWLLLFNPVSFGLIVLFAPQTAAGMLGWVREHDHGAAWYVNWITIHLLPMSKFSIFMEERGVIEFSSRLQKKYFFWKMKKGEEGLIEAANTIGYDVAEEIWRETNSKSLKKELFLCNGVSGNEEILRYFIEECKSLDMVKAVIGSYTPTINFTMELIKNLEEEAKESGVADWKLVESVNWYRKVLVVIIDKFGLNTKAVEALISLNKLYSGIADELLQAAETTAEKQLVCDIANRKSEADWQKVCARRKPLSAKAQRSMTSWMYDMYFRHGMHLDNEVIKEILCGNNAQMVTRVFRYERLNDENAQIVRSNVSLLKLYSEVK